METINLFELLLRREDFREYIREVFKILNEQFDITLDELLIWLNTKKSADNWGSDLQNHIKAGVWDQVELYKFVYPCNVELFRDSISFDVLPPASEELIKIDNGIRIRLFEILPGYTFNVYKISKCFSEDYDLTVSLLRGVLNEGGTQ